MSHTKLISVRDYLRLANSTVHEEHLRTIRDLYRKVLQLSDDDPLPKYPDDRAIIEIARQCNLRIDLDEAKECLRDCVRYGDINDAIPVISGKLAGEEKSMESKLEQVVLRTSPSNPLAPRVTQDATLVTDIDCLLNIKMQTIEVEQFIHSFLLQDIKVSHQQVTT